MSLTHLCVRAVFFTKLIKKALGKPQSTSEEEQDQATDTDQHESLPYDTKGHKPQSGEVHALHAIIHKWSTGRNSQKGSTKLINNHPTIK